MSKTVRGVSLASLLLLLCAVGSCYVGERQWENEVRQEERYMEASGFYISDVPTETNPWQFAGFLMFFASVSVAVAAFMLWGQDRKASS
jgi:hypothetical protein